MIDKWFLYKLKNLSDFEKELSNEPLDENRYIEGKKLGYTDGAIERISGQKPPCHLPVTYRMVDTCGGEFAATTPYFYGTYNTAESGGGK